MPAETEVVELVRAHRVTSGGAGAPLFLSARDAEGNTTWTVARTDRGGCVFLDREGGRLCVIHRELGENALPSACRHFPRRVLHDARGTLISLSHFCPTAAQILLNEGTLSIVDARAPLLLTSAMEGLDARDALPPLVRPGLLCDMDGYAAWERLGIEVFAQPDVGYEQCLGELTEATERVRDWRPGVQSMSDHVTDAFGKARCNRRNHRLHDEILVERVAALTANLTGGDVVVVTDFEQQWDRWVGRPGAAFDRVVKRYLAARLFGNWIAYQGRGLRSIVEWLRTCAAIVRHFALQGAIASEQPLGQLALVDAVRSADLLLLHVLDSATFARAVGTLEEMDYA